MGPINTPPPLFPPSKVMSCSLRQDLNLRHSVMPNVVGKIFSHFATKVFDIRKKKKVLRFFSPLSYFSADDVEMMLWIDN